MKASLVFFLSAILPLSVLLALGLHFNSFILDEETDNYSINVSYPHYGNKKIENILRNYIDDYIASFKKELNNEPSSNWKNSLDISHERFSFSENIVSYVFYIYTFTGGAHGGTNIVTKSFNTDTLNELNLENVFEEDENYLEKISELAIKNLKENLISKDATPDSIKFSEEWIEEGASPKKENFKRFSLTKKEIVFYFEQYQVAPYSDGIQTVKIPYYELENFLKEPFSKQKKSNKSKDLERQAERDCNWEDFKSKNLGINFMIQKCNWKEDSPIFLESGDSIIQTQKKTNTKKDEFKIIEVFRKKEDEDFEEVINKKFVSKLSRTERNHCLAKQSFFILDDRSKINFVIEPDTALQERILQETPEGEIPRDPCGEYGISGNGFIKYFEYHPEESKTKFIFVRVGQDPPFFDEKTIKLE